MSARRWRRAVAVAVGSVLLVSGCAQPVDLAPRAAAELQAGVLDVARAAAQGRYDAAAAAAADLRVALDAAAQGQEISVARYAEIDAALSRTEAEIAVQVEALEAARAAEQAAAEQAAAEQAAAEQAAAEQAAAEQAAAEQKKAEEAASGAGPGAGGAEKDPPKGPGENKGKGKG